jgi:hypothetical protein
LAKARRLRGKGRSEGECDEKNSAHRGFERGCMKGSGLEAAVPNFGRWVLAGDIFYNSRRGGNR